MHAFLPIGFLCALSGCLVACAPVAPTNDSVAAIRALPEPEQRRAVQAMTIDEQVDLFFAAADRHPPYMGLQSELAGEGPGLLRRLRVELDARGSVPSVLSFLAILHDARRQGALPPALLEDLRLGTICELAKGSTYCPEARDGLRRP